MYHVNYLQIYIDFLFQMTCHHFTIFISVPLSLRLLPVCFQILPGFEEIARVSAPIQVFEAREFERQDQWD